MDIADEYGIPLALYAAFPLLGSENDRTFLVDHFKAWLESEMLLPPEAYFRMKDLAAKLLESSSNKSGLQALKAGLERLDERLAPAWG